MINDDVMGKSETKREELIDVDHESESNYHLSSDSNLFLQIILEEGMVRQIQDEAWRVMVKVLSLTGYLETLTGSLRLKIWLMELDHDKFFTDEKFYKKSKMTLEVYDRSMLDLNHISSYLTFEEDDQGSYRRWCGEAIRTCHITTWLSDGRGRVSDDSN